MDKQEDLVHTSSSDNSRKVSNVIEKRDKLVSETDNFVHETLQKLGRRNFWLYVSINISSLLLTLSITFVGLLDEQQIPANQRKILTGTLGAILATLQTAAATFNLKRKYEGYFNLEVEGRSLLLDIDEVEENKDLKECKVRLKELRSSALKLEL